MNNSLPEGVIVREATEKDIPMIAQINGKVFLGNRDNIEHATSWVRFHMAAYPAYHYFVIEKDGVFAGYAGMQIHGGFLRASPVVEVEQVGIDPAFQGQRLGPLFMKEAIRQSAELVQKLDNRIESHITFTVWVYEHNERALKVYKKVFTDWFAGERTQYGDRKEIMLRLRVPLVIHERE